MTLETAAFLAFYAELAILTLIVAIYEVRKYYRKHKERV